MVFITRCTEGKQRLFGTTEAHGITRSSAGRAFMHHWQTIPQVFTGIGIDSCIVIANVCSATSWLNHHDWVGVDSMSTLLAGTPNVWTRQA